MMTHEDMDRLTAGLASKAAKVRALHEADVSTGDIGRYLGIRYQQVYNVLLRAGAIEKPEKGEVGARASVGGPVIMGCVNSTGGIELPASILEKHGLVPDSPVYCLASPDGLVLLSQEAAQRAVAQAVREKMPDQAALLEALFNLKAGGHEQSP